MTPYLLKVLPNLKNFCELKYGTLIDLQYNLIKYSKKIFIQKKQNSIIESKQVKFSLLHNE